MWLSCEYTTLCVVLNEYNDDEKKKKKEKNRKKYQETLKKRITKDKEFFFFFGSSLRKSGHPIGRRSKRPWKQTFKN